MHLDVFIALKAIESQNILAHKVEVFTFPGEETEFHTGWMTVLAQITNFEVVCNWKSKVLFLSGALESSQEQTKEIQKMKSKSDCGQSHLLILPHLCTLLWFTPLTLHPDSPFLVVKTSAMGGTPCGTPRLAFVLYLFLALQRIRILSSAWRPSLTSLHKIVSLVSISSSPQSWHVLSSYHFFSLN